MRKPESVEIWGWGLVALISILVVSSSLAQNPSVLPGKLFVYFMAPGTTNWTWSQLIIDNASIAKDAGGLYHLVMPQPAAVVTPLQLPSIPCKPGVQVVKLADGSCLPVVIINSDGSLSPTPLAPTFGQAYPTSVERKKP